MPRRTGDSEKERGGRRTAAGLGRGVPRWRGAALLVIALGASAVAAPALAAEAFVPNEQLVSPNPDLIDPEYSQSRAQLTWVDRDGRLWIGNINRRTGQFQPRNGKAILVDTEAMTTNDLVTVGNGPEWINTAGDQQIVYTRFVPGQPHTLEQARLAIAIERVDQTWTPATLDDRPRNAPYPSPDPRGEQPRISYVDDVGNHYWRSVFEPDSETLVPDPMRFVDGQKASLFRAPDAQGTTQIFRYWLDSGAQEQLTDDAGHGANLAAPWMWRAPEFDNQYVMATVANGNTELRIYRKLDPGQRYWSVVRTVTVPGGRTIGSPEPFVLRARSYVLMDVAPAGSSAPTAIAFASIDPDRPLFRQVSPDDDSRIRMDPELFVTSDGTAYLYFNRFNPALLPSPQQAGSNVILCRPCSEGIWRSNIDLMGP